MDEVTDKVGLGVDLIGGPETLVMLRAIRAEMVAVQQLSGRGPNGPGSPFGTQLNEDLRAREKVYAESNRRIAEDRVRTERRVSQEEVDIRAKAANQKLELNQRINTRAEQLRAEEQRRQITAQREEAERHRNFLEQRRLRIRQFASDPNIASQDFSKQRQAFRRLSPFDPQFQTTIDPRYRLDLAEKIQGQRLAQREAQAEQSKLEAQREYEQARLASRFARGRAGSLTTFDPDRPLTRPVPSAAEAEKAALRKYIQGGGDLAKFKFSGGGGPPDEGGEGGGTGGKGGGGFLGPVGRLTRNFLIYRALTGLTFGLARYTEGSLAAAKATTEQGNALKFATEAAEGNLEANRALSVQIEQYGYNRAQAAQTVAAAVRATYRHPEQAAALTQEAVNIAALRGGGLQETPRIIEDIIGGRDRAYREYFNITPNTIYKEAAKKRLAQNLPLTGFRGTGEQSNERYQTDEQKISKYVAALSEEEKEQLRLNYVLSQSARFQGDAAERAGTLAGKMDLVSAAFFNASANVGAFIADVRPIKDILDSITGATPGSVFTPPQLRQTGPRNTITDTDIINFATESSTGPRARALDIVSKTTSLIADNITLVNTLVNAQRKINDLVQGGGISDTEYTSIVAENQARLRQVNQRNALRAQGQLGYRSLVPGQGAPNEYFTYAELSKRGVSGGDILTKYVEDVKPKLDDAAEALHKFREERQKLLDEGNITGANKLEAQNFAEYIGKFRPDDYEAEAAKREDKRRAKELEDRNKYVSELGNTLSKLRDAQQGAFRLPGDIGTSLVGGENPYVKVLSDQITAAERMRQQWGFLGQAAVDYFTKLEQGAARRELNKLEFQTYATATNLRGQADSERLTRGGPGLSRREQDYLDIQSAIVERATTIPRLWAQAAEILGRSVGPTTELVNRIDLITTAFGTRGPNTGLFGNIYNTDLSKESPLTRLGLGNPRFSGLGQLSEFARTGNPLLLAGGQDAFQRRTGNPLFAPTNARDFSDIGRGQSTEVQNALRKSFSDSILDAFKDYSPAQIRSAGLQSYYLGALQVQTGALGFNIEQARRKAELGAAEDARLQGQLTADERFRQAQIAKGYNPRDVGRESDQLLLARTEGIAPKDLTLTQFTARQDALRRQADRAEQDRQEAKAAVEQGLEYQAQMVELLASIRSGLLGGDMSLLVQVQNDTQARIDQSSLQELASGKYNIPLDQSESKTSPYTNSFTRYKRGGRK